MSRVAWACDTRFLDDWSTCMAGPFPHERLVAYHRARQFYRLVIRLRSQPSRGLSDLYDQLIRAGGSVCHNLAEGAASYTPGNKLRYFRIALSSAGECAAALDRLEDHGVLSSSELGQARGILNEVGALTVGLIRRLAPPPDLMLEERATAAKLAPQDSVILKITQDGNGTE